MVILEINSSSRQDSNSKFMADRLLKGLPHDCIDLNQYQINPIIDQRHSGLAWQFTKDDYLAAFNKLLAADVLVFATPIYWYGPSGLLKNFIDRWSQSLATVPDLRQKIKNKIVYLLLVGGDNPHVKGLPTIQQFEYICQFWNWRFTDYVIGTANRPLDIAHDQLAINKLDFLNHKFLEACYAS
ncbi:flavodoxin family protein [Agrilactobacillus fermenti]|uniref:flavodoxin family protein n=1 Tax=Agrilactobacillus fermenti TaxID=2586909 RepID=UPI001E307B2E|nr:flavodoxin family protein [Agrilactobacillus fermenti]MCD2255395.1 flavodoxin family protein [Agrilactobacillus fermenti]